MTTRTAYFCDGCGKEIGTREVNELRTTDRTGETMVEVRVTTYGQAGLIDNNYKVNEWDLCESCVEDIVDAIKAKAGEGKDE